MPERDDDSFLLRWSRRKRAAGEGNAPRDGRVSQEAPRPAEAVDAAADETVVATDATGAGDAVEGRADGAAGGEDGAVPADLADVDIEALDYEADFTRFMKDDVPAALKRRALRQLWRSDPVLANLDGLNDYDGDFTDAALAVKVLETAHKVGRGFLDDETVADTASDDGAVDEVPPTLEADADVPDEAAGGGDEARAADGDGDAIAADATGGPAADDEAPQA